MDDFTENDAKLRETLSSIKAAEEEIQLLISSQVDRLRAETSYSEINVKRANKKRDGTGADENKSRDGVTVGVSLSDAPTSMINDYGTIGKQLRHRRATTSLSSQISFLGSGQQGSDRKNIVEPGLDKLLGKKSAWQILEDDNMIEDVGHSILHGGGTNKSNDENEKVEFENDAGLSSEMSLRHALRVAEVRARTEARARERAEIALKRMRTAAQDEIRALESQSASLTAQVDALSDKLSTSITSMTVIKDAELEACRRAEAAEERVVVLERHADTLRQLVLAYAEQAAPGAAEARSAEQQLFWERLASPDLLKMSTPPPAFPPNEVLPVQTMADIARLRSKLNKSEAEASRLAADLSTVTSALAQEREERRRRARLASDEIGKREARVAGALRRIRYLLQCRAEWVIKEKELRGYVLKLEAKLLQQAKMLSKVQGNTIPTVPLRINRSSSSTVSIESGSGSSGRNRGGTGSAVRSSFDAYEASSSFPPRYRSGSVGGGDGSGRTDRFAGDRDRDSSHGSVFSEQVNGALSESLPSSSARSDGALYDYGKGDAKEAAHSTAEHQRRLQRGGAADTSAESLGAVGRSGGAGADATGAFGGLSVLDTKLRELAALRALAAVQAQQLVNVDRANSEGANTAVVNGMEVTGAARASGVAASASGSGVWGRGLDDSSAHPSVDTAAADASAVSVVENGFALPTIPRSDGRGLRLGGGAEAVSSAEVDQELSEGERGWGGEDSEELMAGVEAQLRALKVEELAHRRAPGEGRHWRSGESFGPSGGGSITSISSRSPGRFRDELAAAPVVNVLRRAADQRSTPSSLPVVAAALALRAQYDAVHQDAPPSLQALPVPVVSKDFVPSTAMGREGRDLSISAAPGHARSPPPPPALAAPPRATTTSAGPVIGAVGALALGTTIRGPNAPSSTPAVIDADELSNATASSASRARDPASVKGEWPVVSGIAVAVGAGNGVGSGMAVPPPPPRFSPSVRGISAVTSKQVPENRLFARAKEIAMEQTAGAQLSFSSGNELVVAAGVVSRDGGGGVDDDYNATYSDENGSSFDGVGASDEYNESPSDSDLIASSASLSDALSGNQEEHLLTGPQDHTVWSLQLSSSKSSTPSLGRRVGETRRLMYERQLEQEQRGYR